jgi:hypothetical protein
MTCEEKKKTTKELRRGDLALKKKEWKHLS